MVDESSVVRIEESAPDILLDTPDVPCTVEDVVLCTVENVVGLITAY
jgi:hypothetical protein